MNEAVLCKVRISFLLTFLPRAGGCLSTECFSEKEER